MLPRLVTMTIECTAWLQGRKWCRMAEPYILMGLFETLGTQGRGCWCMAPNSYQPRNDAHFRALHARRAESGGAWQSPAS